MAQVWTPLASATSLWASTAEPLRAFPSLSSEVQADVVIIGAGYTGLSAAHHIAKSGLTPIILEANRPGWGASGRNGGVITAKFRQSFRGIDAAHGRAMAKRMYEIAHESTEIVEELVSEFGIVAETPQGAVRARQVVIATNSYSDLTPATRHMQHTLVPFRSAIIATDKLPHNLAGHLMPTGRTYTETKRMMRWFRMVDDRVVFGGRGAFGKQDSEAAFDALRKAMIGIFPELADVPLSFQWSGLVGMTLDAVPHIGRLDDQTLFSMGYNGAGVAMSSLMGRYLAAFVRGEKPDVGLLDASRLKSIPFYPLREPAVRMVAGWYQFLDAIGQ